MAGVAVVHGRASLGHAISRKVALVIEPNCRLERVAARSWSTGEPNGIVMLFRALARRAPLRVALAFT